jgi:DHA2 family multidrug resistance protein-like MFS transporter
MNASAPNVSSDRAGRREWAGLAVLALPTLLLALDFSVLFLALPKLAASLHPSGVQQLWILDIYGFMTAGFLVTMGTLGDRIGRRKLLMIGAAIFGAVSIVAAYSNSATMLLIARAALGIAGATLMPSTLALITNMFRNSAERAKAVGIWAMMLMLGIASGPIIGGLLLGHFWWGSVFLIAVPVMVILLVAAPLLLPEYKNPEAAGRIDPLSLVLSLAAILPFVWGIKELAAQGGRPLPIIAMVVGLAFGAIFIIRQGSLEKPLLDIKLFKMRSFSSAFMVLLLGGAVSGGAAFLFIQYLQLVLGKSPLGAGVWLLPYTGAMIIGSMLAPTLAKTIKPAYIVSVGLVIALAGYITLTQVSAVGGLAVAVTGLCIVFFGSAPTWVLGTNLILGSVPPERAGSASSVSETGSEIGVALGVAVLGSVAAAVYRGEIHIPAGVPASTAATAHDSLVGATAVAPTLPNSVGTALLNAGRVAEVHGFNTAAIVGGAVALVLSVLSVVLLRHVPAFGAGDGAGEGGSGTPGETTESLAEAA